MMQKQCFEDVPYGSIATRASDLKKSGYRMVQICGIPGKGETQLIYSFDLDGGLLNIRTSIPDGTEIGSITPQYWSAFVYENEIHDLFGVEFKDLTVDYKGSFFRLSEKTPWKSKGGERYG